MTPTDQTSLIHPSYRHLDRTIRLAGLSLVQWTELVIAGAVAFALAQILPFGGTYNVSVAVTIAGVPIAAALAAGSSAESPIDVLVQTVRWRRAAKLYDPSLAAEHAPAGYRLSADGARKDGSA